MTGGRRRWLRAPAAATPGHSQAALRALWWPPTKIATRYLAPYLMTRDEQELIAARPEGAQPIERRVEP